MIDLLAITIAAHGGLNQWKQHAAISANIKAGGRIWDMRGQPGIFKDFTFTADLLSQQAKFSPFLADDQLATFTPNLVAIKNINGKVIEELRTPRDSFRGYNEDAKWTPLQAAYFLGYALTTYFNTPFQFAKPGFEVTEIEPWVENRMLLRRLKVNFPADVAVHSYEQVFYIGQDGLIFRQDYQVDISGGTKITHYPSDYIEVGGIKIATKRRVYVRRDDNTAGLDGPLVVSLDYSEIELISL